MRQVDFIAANPDAGDIIPGTGGCRKVRIAKQGKGKSGGYRIITYYTSEDEPVFLLTVISKGKQANLTEKQKTRFGKGNNMDKDDFESLQRGLAQVEAFKAGERDGFVVHEAVDVKAIRKQVGKTQAAFAAAYHIPTGTLRDWEQGRSHPDAPARALLAAIGRDPATMEKLLAPS